MDSPAVNSVLGLRVIEERLTQLLHEPLFNNSNSNMAVRLFMDQAGILGPDTMPTPASR